jgi:hypothetical protein
MASGTVDTTGYGGLILFALEPGGAQCSPVGKAFRLDGLGSIPAAIDERTELAALLYHDFDGHGLTDGVELQCTTSSPSLALPTPDSVRIMPPGAQAFGPCTDCDPLPPELASFRLPVPPKPPPPKTQCAMRFSSASFEVPTSTRVEARAGVLISPGVAWVAWAPRNDATDAVVTEVTCTSSTCVATPLHGFDEGSVFAMFKAADGDVWLGTDQGCLWRSHPQTATIAEKHCVTITDPHFDLGTIDGPDRVDRPFELFGAHDNPFRYSPGSPLESVAQVGYTNWATWLGPGEALFGWTSSTSVFHLASDNSVTVEPVAEPAPLTTLAALHVVSGLGPVLAINGRSTNDLYVRGASGWSLYAHEPLIDQRIETLRPFRDGLLFGAQGGWVGQVSNGRPCGNNTPVDPNLAVYVLIDLRLSDQSFLAAGNFDGSAPRQVWRVTPFD